MDKIFSHHVNFSQLLIQSRHLSGADPASMEVEEKGGEEEGSSLIFLTCLNIDNSSSGS